MSESTNEIVIVGLHREGSSVVITDAKGEEHEASTPDGLWKALQAILDDVEIPRTKVPASNIAEVQGLVGIAQNEAEAFVRGRYGDLAGAMAGSLARNGARKIISILQKNSR